MGKRVSNKRGSWAGNGARSFQYLHISARRKVQIKCFGDARKYLLKAHEEKRLPDGYDLPGELRSLSQRIRSFLPKNLLRIIQQR